MIKRVIGFMLGLVMVMSIAACSPREGGGEAAELKECTVKIILPGAEKPADFANVQNAINDKLEEDGKPYTVEMTFYDDTKYHDDLPLKATDGYDMGHVNIEYFKDYLKTNTLIDAKPYIEKHGAAIKSNTPDYAVKASEYNGKQFLIPRSMPVSGPDFAAARGDWMKEYGMTEIKTISDLDTYFAKTHAKIGDPNKNRYVYSADDNYNFLIRAYAPSYFFPIRKWASMPLYIDISEAGKENGKYVVKNYYESDAYIEMITKTREYYNLQYVTPEQLNGSYNYFAASQLGIVWNTLLKQSERVDSFKLSQPQGELYDIYLNDAPKYVFDGIDNTMALLSGCKNPNEAVDFLNWIRTSQENHDLVCYGIKDVNYKLTAEGKLDFDGIAKNKQYSTLMPYWAFNDIRFARWSKNLSNDYIAERKAWNSDAGQSVLSPLIGFKTVIGNVDFDSYVQNVNAVATLATNLTNGRIDPAGAAANGKTNYRDLLDKLNTAGIEKLRDMVQEQIDAYLGQ